MIGKRKLVCGAGIGAGINDANYTIEPGEMSLPPPTKPFPSK